MNSIIFDSNEKEKLFLLENINIEIKKIIIPNIKREKQKKEKPLDYVKRIAIEKCNEILKNNHNETILTAETIIARNGKIFSVNFNDYDRESFKQLLVYLKATNFRVITAFCIAKNDKIITIKVLQTKIKFKQITINEIDEFIKIKMNNNQNNNIFSNHLIEHLVIDVNGNYSNILGLPIYYIKNRLNSLK